MTHNFIHTALRAIAMTALLGLGGVAAPAMAQSPGFGFGPGFDGKESSDPFFYYPDLPVCLTDRQIRRAIADYGYSNITLNVPNNKRIQVRATMDGTVYLLKFNFCSGQIENRDALRSAQ